MPRKNLLCHDSTFENLRHQHLRILLPLLNGEGYISISVCLFVCLFFCILRTLRKNGWKDFHEIFRIDWILHTEQRLNLSYRSCFFCVNPRQLGKLQASGWTKDVAFNLLDSGSIFAFSGSVLASNSMEIRVNRFSWNFQDILFTKIGWTVWRPTIVFQDFQSMNGVMFVSTFTENG